MMEAHLHYLGRKSQQSRKQEPGMRQTAGL
jgi:hypothetical protein